MDFYRCFFTLIHASKCRPFRDLKIHHNSFAKMPFQQDNKPYMPQKSLTSCILFTHLGHSSEKISYSQCYLNEINKVRHLSICHQCTYTSNLNIYIYIFRSIIYNLYMELSLTAMNFAHRGTNIKSNCYFYSGSALLGLTYFTITTRYFNTTLQIFISHHIHTVWDYFPDS